MSGCMEKEEEKAYFEGGDRWWCIVDRFVGYTKMTFRCVLLPAHYPS